jgi:hypothetical protein
MNNKLKSTPIALAFAVWSALVMLILWILANAGVYTTAAQQMSQMHMFFNLTLGGLITGMIEAALISYILAYIFVWIYNLIRQ